MERYDFVASGEWKSSMNNKRRDNEPLDVAIISSWHSKQRSDVWYGYVLLTIGRPALRMASPSAGTEVMGFLHMFADARMPISGSLGDLVQLLAGRAKQDWAALVLSGIALNADDVRHHLRSLVKTELSKFNET